MDATKGSIKRFACSLPPSIPQPHPWLVISHGKHRQRQTFFSISQNHHYVRTIPELRGQAIRASHNEWLVLTDFNLTECSLFNLVSMERIQLPPMQSKHHTLCVLSSSPDSSYCHIVFIDNMSSFSTSLLMCKPGDDKFVEQEINLVGALWESATTCNGNIYLLNRYFSLFVLDFNRSRPRPGSLEVIYHGQSRQGVLPNIVDYIPWLVESNGDLFFVTMLYYGYNFREVYGFVVNRFDFTAKSWVEVQSIGKTRALFLDTQGGMSCSATEESRLKGNSIYFIKSNDRHLYVFDLEKKTISVPFPCPNVSRPYLEETQPGRRRRHSEFHWITIPDVRKLP